jgi:hypothetical protein
VLLLRQRGNGGGSVGDAGKERGMTGPAANPVLLVATRKGPGFITAMRRASRGAPTARISSATSSTT